MVFGKCLIDKVERLRGLPVGEIRRGLHGDLGGTRHVNLELEASLTQEPRRARDDGRNAGRQGKRRQCRGWSATRSAEKPPPDTDIAFCCRLSLLGGALIADK